jgi:pyridoxamine 5'-phosphate oxidase
MFGSDIDIDAVVEDPLDLLDRWLAPVGTTPAGTDVTSTPLMALATVDADGFPRVRHVLLSAYARGRLSFHTDERSAKTAQLGDNPRAGATIFWPENARQLSVSGTVEREPTDEAALAFARRSRYLQVLAWVNDPELTRLGATERRRLYGAFDASHAQIEAPPTWAGYTLVPELISFWRGVGDGPSQRVSCRRTHSGWSVERLPG